MQVMMTELNDRKILDLLAQDLFERNKKLRHETIVNQIVSRIAECWLYEAKNNNLWDKPTKCVVRFVMQNEAGIPVEGSGFALTATLDHHGPGRYIETYVKRIRNALTYMKIDLCNNYDLDRLQFDTDPETGRESIKVFEYRDIAKGF